MSNYRKHIDEFFKEKLGRYKETPPADVWEDLDKRLDGLLPPAPDPYRWMIHVGIVSLILVLSVSLVHKMTGNSGVTANAANEPVVAKADIPASAVATKAAEGATTKEQATENGNSSTANNAQQTNNNEPGAANTNNKNAVAKNNTTGNRHGTSKANSKIAGNKQQTAGAKSQLPAENNYNAGIGDKSVKEFTADNGKGGPSANTEAQVQPATAKKELQKAQTTVKPAAKTAAATFSRFEAGVKVGYEKGFNDLAANKYTVSPYLQYNISQKFSILTQPAMKYATISSRNIGTPQSYYNVDPNQKITNEGTVDNTYIVGGQTEIQSTTITYSYAQNHDSIAKTYTYGGSYLEFEVPILAKYKITKSFSVYGGVNLLYSKVANVTEHTYTSQPISKTIGDIAITTPAGAQPAAPPASINAGDISYPGSPYSSYTGPVYAMPASGTISCGYMLGFSYEYTKKWLFDALIEQAPMKTDMLGGYNINNPLSTTYFRLSIGYKLTK